MRDLEYIRITIHNKTKYAAAIAELEKIAVYPIGSDFFQIDHGDDYFRFFERLGQMHYYIAIASERVVAVACGILRNIYFPKIKKYKKCWYLCDLKVHPDFRGQHIPLKMLKKMFWQNYIKAPRGYFISMNPSQGQNRIVRLISKFTWVKAIQSCTLEIFTIDYKQFIELKPILQKHRGQLGLLTLRGIKDIILKSTGQPMPLLHIQFGADATNNTNEPSPAHVYMFCTIADDPLSKEVKAADIKPTATASVVYHKMTEDWRFILTSDI